MSYQKDALDEKVTSLYPGKAVRKDLVHRIKKGTNVPTFVLEFLLAKFCATDDEEEIEDGLEAVITTLQENYVRADEANAAQSKVSTRGRFRFIDKVGVNYIEKDRRHWAALENFGSKRIAVNEKFFKDNERLLEGGIWAEVTVAYNDVEEDDYSFYIEDLRPIQLARFDFEGYVSRRKDFSRDEWLNLILRSVGLEPEKLNNRQKFHFIARMASLVQANYNYIELGPRGTGKSYFFSEFSPYATLVSGGQSTKSTLFYNMVRRRPGLVSYWDTVAFDEVAGIRIKDPDTMQIMKDYMANGRFSRGTEVIANAGLAFVGNLDLSVEQIVNSPDYDLFQPMPKEFDLAVMDRFAAYIPGWEMPKTDSSYLTTRFGFISDYLAEAFHYLFKHVNVYEEVNKRLKLGPCVQGRDEMGIKKTLCAFLKILHPDNQVTPQEFEEYVHYALECRRRVKEQMNKRKPDEEFAKIALSYFDAGGVEHLVSCPESQDAPATQNPRRTSLGGEQSKKGPPLFLAKEEQHATEKQEEAREFSEDSRTQKVVLEPRDYSVCSGETGLTYEKVIGPYLNGAESFVIEDPYIRQNYQIQNFLSLCELAVKTKTVREITLKTRLDTTDEKFSAMDWREKMEALTRSLAGFGVTLDIDATQNELHDRRIVIDNGWEVLLGRGLDWYLPVDRFTIGAGDPALRACRQMEIRIKKVLPPQR